MYCYCLVTKMCLTLCDPRDYTVHGILQASPGDLPTPWIEPVFLALAGGFFTTEPPGKFISMYVRAIIGN